MSHHSMHHFHHVAEAISHEHGSHGGHGSPEEPSGAFWLTLCGKLFVLFLCLFWLGGSLIAGSYFAWMTVSCLLHPCT